MEEQSHPDHKKIGLVSVISLTALSIFPFAYGLYIHDPMADHQFLFDASVIAFMTLMGGAFAADVIGWKLRCCAK
jgi:hypothetical protein